MPKKKNKRWKEKRRETTTALCLQINAGNFLMPPYSLPRLTQSEYVCCSWWTWCQHFLVCKRESAGLNRVCSFWSLTETGIGCTHRLTFLTAQIRNGWNADSVCLQCRAIQNAAHHAGTLAYLWTRSRCWSFSSVPVISKSREIIVWLRTASTKLAPSIETRCKTIFTSRV